MIKPPTTRVHENGATPGAIQHVNQKVGSSHTLGLAKLDIDRIVVGQAITARVGGVDVSGEIVQHPTYEKERRKAKLG